MLVLCEAQGQRCSGLVNLSLVGGPGFKVGLEHRATSSGCTPVARGNHWVHAGAPKALKKSFRAGDNLKAKDSTSCQSSSRQPQQPAAPRNRKPQAAGLCLRHTPGSEPGNELSWSTVVGTGAPISSALDSLKRLCCWFQLTLMGTKWGLLSTGL